MRDDAGNIDASNAQRARKLKIFFATLSVLVLTIAVLSRWLPINTPLPKAFAATATQLDKQMQSQARLPAGYSISLFATGLDRARLMVETPKGDLIVSSRGSKIYFVSADHDKDGMADHVRALMSGLNQPHGVLLHKGWLYVAEEHRVFRVRLDADKGTVEGKPETILKGLPDNGGHSSRTLKKGPDGWFYLSIGSSCNVCEESHPWRAAILRFHPDNPQKPQIFATGLRNTVGFDWQPATGQLYGVENGRDWLGDHFPPDELNHIEQSGFYGWPYRHGDNIPDDIYGKAFSGEARTPAFSFDAHIAPLSVRFLRYQKAPEMQNTALVAQHGSWNRSTKHGYRLVSLHFSKNGGIKRKVFLSGFLKDGTVLGRPVDVIERKDGSLLISDDFADVLWLVKYKN